MMRRAAALLLIVTAAVCAAGPVRFARAGNFEGTAEVRLNPADPWEPALRNLPLREGARVRTTGAASRLEIELDDGSVLRLTGDALAEISDYARLSSGQRITVISLDRGTAYFTGEPRPRDILSIAAPGAQITLRRGSRVRLEVDDSATQIAIIEGLVRFGTSSAEMDLREGQVTRVGAGAKARFSLFREIPQLDTDGWSDKLDKAEARAHGRNYLPGVQYGALDLDRAGVWIRTDDLGTVWQPKVEAGWAPFRSGAWRWFDDLGYTWVSAEPWGWTPYHHGRWQQSSLGWVWAPGASTVFKPGDVYWMRATSLAIWGPLAPGEHWTGAGPSALFAAANSTVARFTPGIREFAPSADVTKPKDLLSSAAFTVALPSPAMIADRLDAIAEPLRPGTAPVNLISLDSPVTIPSAAPQPSPPPPAPQQPVASRRPIIVQPPPVIVEEPVVEEVYFPVPVYWGVVVLNPPLKKPAKTDKNKSTSTP